MLEINQMKVPILGAFRLNLMPLWGEVHARREIFEYIEFHYNRVRSHSYLGNLSPSRFEEVNVVLQLETAA